LPRPLQARTLVAKSEIYVSAASIWEISIKAAIGKLTADPREVLAALGPAGFIDLLITGDHATQVADLPPIHCNPFDRLLDAQALAEPMRLLKTSITRRTSGSTRAPFRPDIFAHSA